VPRAHEVEDGPRALPRALVEEPNPVELNPEGALGDLLLIEQEEEILAQLLVAELVRRASVVVRQLADGVEIALWGRGGQAPELQVFQHPASKAGHGHPPVRMAYELSPRVDTTRKREGSSRGGKRKRPAEHRGDS
jgi:hypothetical protein